MVDGWQPTLSRQPKGQHSANGENTWHENDSVQPMEDRLHPTRILLMTTYFIQSRLFWTP